MGIFRRYNCSNVKCGRNRRGPGACKCGGSFVPGPWCVEYTHRGKRRTEAAGSKARASHLLAERLKSGPPASIPIKDLWEKFSKTRTESTRAVEKRYWELRFGEWFGGLDARELTREMILLYIGSRRPEAKDSTIGREVAILRGMWNYAVMEGWVSGNPFLKLGVSANQREPINKYLLPEEWDLLYDHLPVPTRDYYLFLWETAARSKEARELTWPRVDFGRKLSWVKGKGRGMEPLYLSDRILSVLESMDKTTDTVFTNRYGNAVSAPRTVLMDTANKSGLNRILKNSGRSEINGPHYLRHAAISRWVMQGEDLVVVMRLSRHSSYEMVLRYSHLAPEKMHKAVNR